MITTVSELPLPSSYERGLQDCEDSIESVRGPAPYTTPGEFKNKGKLEWIVGVSPALRSVLAHVTRVAAQRFHGADPRGDRCWQGVDL